MSETLSMEKRDPELYFESFERRWDEVDVISSKRHRNRVYVRNSQIRAPNEKWKLKGFNHVNLGCRIQEQAINNFAFRQKTSKVKTAGGGFLSELLKMKGKSVTEANSKAHKGKRRGSINDKSYYSSTS